MRRLLFLTALMVLLTSCGSKEDRKEQKETVYICTGSYSKRYHTTDECRGLCNCQGGVEEVSLSEAESMGRTPCQICH